MSPFAELLDKEFTAIRGELAELREQAAKLSEADAKREAFMQAFLASVNDEVDTDEALRLSGIASRTTLIAERQRPGTLLTYTHHGRSVRYGRAGCIAYKLAHQHQVAA